MDKSDIIRIADSEYGAAGMIDFCLRQNTLTHQSDLLAAAIGLAIVEGTEHDTTDSNRLAQACSSLDDMIEQIRDVKDAISQELEKLQ